MEAGATRWRQDTSQRGAELVHAPPGRLELRLPCQPLPDSAHAAPTAHQDRLDRAPVAGGRDRCRLRARRHHVCRACTANGSPCCRASAASGPSPRSCWQHTRSSLPPRIRSARPGRLARGPAPASSPVDRPNDHRLRDVPIRHHATVRERLAVGAATPGGEQAVAEQARRRAGNTLRVSAPSAAARRGSGPRRGRRADPCARRPPRSK